MKSRHSQGRHWLAIGLAATSFLGAIEPVLADGTAPGQAIRNRATATFSDGTTTFNSTSNTVEILVSEVAGIDITAQTPSSTSANPGQLITVDFIIANTGNDPTQFFIPGTATLSNTTAFQLDASQPIQIVAINGGNSTLPTPVNVPPAGGLTSTLLGATQGVIAPRDPAVTNSGTITVRVPVRVLPTATSGQTLTVSLGNTATLNSDNVTRVNDPVDVYTEDNANGVSGETNGAPVNGVREAMDTSSTITVGSRLQAFATVLKAIGNYSNGSNPNSMTDDVLTYNFALRVDTPSTMPAGLNATDLHGTQLNITGLSASNPYVLVADAIPNDFVLAAANPTAPGNWTAVYSITDLATPAHQAAWTTARPASGITRVGFVYNTAPTASGGNGPLPRSTTAISGFSMQVSPTAGFTGGQIANIAQVFGQSQPGAPVPGTATQLVYDESGDQTFNNGLEGLNPDPTSSGGVTPGNGGITNGVANPTIDGTDPGTGNDPTTNGTNQGVDTGTGSGSKPIGGEATVYTIATTPLNGPNGAPGATGPTGTNDDFTNKSIIIPADLDPGTSLTDAQTPPISFSNTVQNTSGATQVISLLPTGLTGLIDPEQPLPNGTKVTLSDGTNSATYLYNGTTFVFDSGTGTSATQPLRLTVPAGTNNTANYTTTIDLPGNTPQLKAYPVSIVAFVDTNNDGLPANEPSNATINRVYTNYLSLVKEARILEVDANNQVTEIVAFTQNQASLSPEAKPGRIIEYRITYKNIATPNAGSSTSLPANNLVITEDGNTPGATGNNWAASTIDPKYPTPANGSAVDSTSGSSIVVTTGANPTDIDILKYVDTVPSVAPGATGTFIFQRKIK